MPELKYSSVSDARRVVLKTLARQQYATADQLVYWQGDRGKSWVYEQLASLEQSRLVIRHKPMQPHVFELTRRGYRLAGAKAPMGSRVKSWSVMSHRCHRNSAEIRLREHYPTFQFLPRSALYRYGVNPGHGEHFGVADDVRIFMLLDDYFFDSSRIGHAWNRTHVPHRAHFDRNSRVHKWSEMATLYVIAATDPQQYNEHKQYIAKHALEDTTAMLKLEAIW